MLQRDMWIQSLVSRDLQLTFHPLCLFIINIVSHDALRWATHMAGCWCICSWACWRAGLLHHGKDPDRRSSAPVSESVEVNGNTPGVKDVNGKPPYLKLQRELVGGVFAHLSEIRIEVVQLHGTEPTHQPIKSHMLNTPNGQNTSCIIHRITYQPDWFGLTDNIQSLNEDQPASSSNSALILTSYIY